jgi:sterol desaturase/sphingolipid hydroxylase (fatty acid hydroxylase superfamily)
LIYSINENIFLHITTVRNFSDETAMTQVEASPGGFRYVWPLLFVLLFLSVFIFEAVSVYFLADDPWQRLLLTIKRCYWSFWQSVLISPWFYLGVPILFIIEWAWPAQRGAQSFGTNTRLDFFYTLAMIPFYAVTAPLFYTFLRQIYEQLFWFIDLSSSMQYPVLTEILVGYLLVDFHGWLHHYVRHKVPVFWEFHSVHHSQVRMNPFTNERVHPLDWFTANIIKFLPAFFFSDALNVGLAYIIIHKFLDRLNHSNVRTNLGWFRYVFVTPQSHRVHHSNRKEHYDKNFGVSLSIWDHLFGTQHRDYNIYPDTGIPDYRFPIESSTDGTVFKIIRIYVRQMIYPFILVWNKTLRRS